jgi:ABC-type multidrug transport system fused ATPase/permease subunit
VIAHRLSTVRHADLIAVLEEGSIVELGTHEHLMRCKGLYRNLYDRQFGAAA